MSETGGTQAAIMEATFDALVKHGYADLTIQTIADEFEKSKSLLYYHYDAKDALLEDFLRYLTEEFGAEVREIHAESPEAQLEAVLDMLVPRELDGEARGLRQALFELRSQAPYSERYAAHFEALDARIEEAIATTLAEGVEAGVFDADPEAAARQLTALVNGEMLRVLTGGTDPEVARATVDDFVDGLRG